MHDFSFFSNKQVLVTGGAGFIGSHLVENLLKAGAIVTAVDNFITGKQENLTGMNVQFIHADVIQPPASYLPAEFTPDVVLHFASPASPPQYQAHPIETYQVNAWATHNLLEWLHQVNPAARFLFASTSEVYGDPAVHPQPESYWGNVNPNGPRSCYDEAKRLGETICGTFIQLYQQDVRIVRIFNTYGPRINPADGRIIPQFITEALQNKPFSIFGDGKQTRSYCYVQDLVEGILLMASKDGLQGETVNLGNPDEKTVLETAQIIKELTGSSSDLNFQQLPKDDPTRRKPDISKAQQLLGWQPQVSLEEGLKKTIEYFKAL